VILTQNGVATDICSSVVRGTGVLYGTNLIKRRLEIERRDYFALYTAFDRSTCGVVLEERVSHEVE